MFNADKDGYIDINELIEMFKAIDLNCNKQLLNILLAMFDKNGDQRISLEEFEGKLGPYVDWKPIEAAQITGDIIPE